MVYVYVLSNRTGRLTAGITRHIVRYLQQHRQEVAPSCTHEHQFDRLLLSEPFRRSADARARERQINGYTLTEKLGLIRVTNPGFDDLIQTLPP